MLHSVFAKSIRDIAAVDTGAGASKFLRRKAAAPHEPEDPALMKIYADKNSPRANGEGWHTENRLYVGDIGPHRIEGSCDLYAPSGLVHFVTYDLRRVSGTSDVGCGTDGPSRSWSVPASLSSSICRAK